MTELDVRTIPGYVVHERLESSAVGTTYLASRVSDGYPVVLQVLTSKFSHPAAAAALRLAIDDVSDIRHPVIPTIWEVGEADGLLYTISNAVEGRSLAALLADQRRLPHDETLAVATELADALEMLSSAGIVHGAITPRTVWINDRARSPSAPYVSLRGFGTTPLLAHHAHTDRQRPPPADLLYVAPEQVNGDPPTDRSDQYALACLVLHALTGDPLFDRPTIDALFSAHRTQLPDDAHLRADELPRRVVDGLRRALAKDPADRFDSSMVFATTIGGTARRSWSWMIEEASTIETTGPAGEAPLQIDLRDDVGPPAPTTVDTPDRSDVRSAHTGHDRAAPPADDERLTARSLADLDWLPPSATRAGPRRRVTPPPTPPRTDTAPGSEPLPGKWRRWASVGLVLVAIAAGVAAVAPTLLAPRSTDETTGVAGPPTTGTTQEIEATWRTKIANGPVTELIAAEEELFDAAGAQLSSLDQETGQQRWTTTVDGAVGELAVMGLAVIAQTPGGFIALDRGTGEPLWRSADTDLPAVEAFAVGRGRMFAAGPPADGGLAIHAIDPAAGEVGWSMAAEDGGSRDSAVGLAYDGSERGGRTLYVATDEQLYAFDTTTREIEWQIPVSDPHPASLTAVAGAVLVIDNAGRLCRYDAADGGLAWSECAQLERPRTTVSMVQVRDSRVIVAGTHEIMAVDFTSGKTQWRIVTEQELQPAMASNPAATFIAAPDGTVEALTQGNGASLWESAPFGEISAMTATDHAVFVTTVDGRLTRLEAPSGEN
ncbi:MAG: PQQ-binding-like beta-propeller repeat protein [Actinobacteria bacterium]|nr:PQQ-binding-like beta-propeller repeat protein [Actinomycetota bacterium]